MGSGRGRTTPGARTSRPAASRPARSRPGLSSHTGSARGSEPAARSGGTPAPSWRERLERARGDRRTLWIASLAVTALFLAVLVGPTLRAYISQRQDIAALQEQVASQREQIDQLRTEQTRWEDPAYVEQQARERLKFVKVGEKAYTVLDPAKPSATVTVPGTNVASASGTDGSWYAALLSSLAAADAPAATR